MNVLVGVVVTALAAFAVHRWYLRRVARQVDDALALVPGAVPDRSRSLTGALGELRRATSALERGCGQLEDRELRLARSLDAIAQGVVVVDGDGDVVFTNEAGSLYSEARHGDALVEAAIADLVGRALDGERCIETIELFGPPKRTLVITAIPLDDERTGAGAVAVIDDVTERRRLEAVRRDFVANISHELKTPVGALALLAETLVDEDDVEVAHRLAERMFTEAHRVARTIEDLLDLSRIEAEENPHRETVPVAAIVHDAIERMRPAAEQKQITLEVEPVNERITLVGDTRQLVSAVFNLLENAVKYSEAGSTVHVRALTDGVNVDLQVEDHGMGIPTRDLERVFERFYRIDRARSRQTGGTGLGLAIVRHVVNNHHGEVLVESVEGEGSTFTLRLPAGAGPVPVTTPEAG
ncbi:MAG: sensor histidine kinase [Acidimicrobiales bacterium]